MVPSRISVVLVEETKAGDTSRPCDDHKRQPLAHMTGRGGAVSEGDTRSPCGGGGALPSSGTAGKLLPVKVTKAPTLSVEGPRSVPSRISVVLVDGTIAGDTPGRECPREDGFWRLWAGETKPAGVSVGSGDAGRSRVGETLSSLDVAGRLRPVVAAGVSSSVGTANPVGSDGPVVTGSPIGPCETLSPLFQSALEPLEHSVPEVILERSSRKKLSALEPLEHSVPDEILERSSRRKFSVLEPLEHSVPDVVLERSSRRKVSALDPLEHSGLDQAGPVGRHVVEGPACPKKTLLGLDPLEHLGLDRADPAGRHTAVGPVGLFGTLSPSDCYPAGPAGPYVAGGPVGPDEKFQVLYPLEHSGPDHADPAGQHVIFREVLEPLEHSALDTTLHGRPMAGFPVLGPIDHSVLEITLDGGHSEMTIDEEPLAHSVLDVTLDGQPMEGISVPEPLEHSVLGGGGGRGGGWTADSWRGCHI